MEQLGGNEQTTRLSTAAGLKCIDTINPGYVNTVAAQLAGFQRHGQVLSKLKRSIYNSSLAQIIRTGGGGLTEGGGIQRLLLPPPEVVLPLAGPGVEGPAAALLLLVPLVEPAASLLLLLLLKREAWGEDGPR